MTLEVLATALGGAFAKWLAPSDVLRLRGASVACAASFSVHSAHRRLLVLHHATEEELMNEGAELKEQVAWQLPNERAGGGQPES